MSSQIGLVDVVQALRSELARASALATGEDIQFPVGQITLEFQVGVTTSAEARGGVRFWVLELGAQAGVSAESVQKVTIQLDPPVDAYGRPVRVSAGETEKPG
ncbi:trypco2 family protein [Hamadaea tsunoensis]|uniref:trypco2 family protein n=1 Tax=Hamadaea tsunoensis TaxID=53368 RepID=UPI00040D4CD6|nr:trypco2 family protein [Hamadaea tsunoensis]